MKNKDYLSELGINPADLQARGLIRYKEANELEIVETNSEGRNFLLDPQAAKAWRILKKNAETDNISIYIVSAYRSILLQEQIINNKLAIGAKIDKILKVCAAPGYSEHHTGLAIDIGTLGLKPLEIDFETTKAFSWLTKNAKEFGFSLSFPQGNTFGYQYEPWHWCFKKQL